MRKGKVMEKIKKLQELLVRVRYECEDVQRRKASEELEKDEMYKILLYLITEIQIQIQKQI